jgi:hypothetical protein
MDLIVVLYIKDFLQKTTVIRVYAGRMIYSYGNRFQTLTSSGCALRIAILFCPADFDEQNAEHGELQS